MVSTSPARTSLPAIRLCTTAWPNARPAGWSWWLGALALAGLWLLARPYTGVRHDGILYLGQIFLHFQPEVFRHDLFFAYGSQDQFSLFSSAAATLVTALGLERAQLLMLGVSHALLLLAAGSLLRSIASVPLRVAGLACVAVAPHFYAGLGVFSFAESFVTARTIAEPLALAGLVALMAGRRLLAILALLAALLSHPLVTLPVIVVSWIFLCMDDRRWLWLALPAGIGVSAASALQLTPFDRLLMRYDQSWLQVVLSSNPFVFPHKWTFQNLLVTALDLFVLTLASRAVPQALSRLCLAVAGTSAMLTLVAAIGAGMLDNVLITQLQLWRGLWLTHLLTLLLLPVALAWVWNLGRAWRPATLALACVAIAVAGEWTTAWAFVLWAGLLAGVARAPEELVSERAHRSLLIASGAAIAGLSVALFVRNLGDLADKGVKVDPSVVMWAAVTTPALTLTLIWVALISTQTLRAPRILGAVIATGLFAIGIHEWDRRTPWQRAFEAPPIRSHPFTLKTRPDSQVYWRDSLLATWSMLGRPSYFTEQQGSGVLFNRATAMEYERRRKSLTALSFQRELCMMLGGLGRNQQWSSDCLPDEDLVTQLCRTLRGPDYLVFTFALSRGVIEQFTIQQPGVPATTYHLHDCTQLR